MRKLFLALLALLLIPVVCVTAATYSHADLHALPQLESGDLIFETTNTPQTPAIIFATHSLYTHVGVIHKQATGITVIQAMRHVAETPFADFIRSGWGEQFTILRYPGLDPAEREAIVKDAESYLGRGYNFVFYMPGKEIYCSELPYFAFRSVHKPIGMLQKIGDLHMNNPAVHRLFEARWHMHPACQKPGMSYDACWKAVLEEPVITPVSLARDPKLQQIYSNYLF